MIGVLHLIEALGTGGAERRLMNDLKYLDKSSFFNVVCALSEKVEMWYPEFSSIPLYRLEARNISELMGCVRPLSRIIRKHGIQIIHTQLFWADLLGRLVKLFNPGIKLVSTIQSTAHENNNSYLYSYKRKLLDGFSGRFLNDGFIAVSRHVRNVCVDHVGFPAAKIRLIPNSVDLDYPVSLANTDQLRQEFGLAKDIVLITVGRIDPPKGHVYLLRAMPAILKVFPQVKLLVVGDGPTRKEVEREAISLGLGEKVIFAGKRGDVRELLSISDIFVFPTLSEGMPLALLEAMALGKACVATSIEPNREVIEEAQAGILVKPADPEDISRAVIDLLTHPLDMQGFSVRGAQLVVRKFSARSCAEDLGKYYKELLKQ